LSLLVVCCYRGQSGYPPPTAPTVTPRGGDPS
ncbi:hypothetical protein VCHC68A1_02762B, partial [Vibrio cholerae HC-68A1]